MGISKKVAENLKRSSWIRAMFEEGEKLRKVYGPENVYDFTLGNPDIEPPDAFKEELKKAALSPAPGMHRYMSNAGYSKTRQAVAEVLSEESGLDLTEENIVMTVGAGGALNVVLKTLLNPGEEVIIIPPYFVEYNFYIDNHGGIVKAAPAKEDFQLDLGTIEAAITPKTKAIIINSPNNPTGVVYDGATLENLGKLLKKKEAELGTEIYVISDEPYAKISYDGIKVPNVFKHIDNSIIVTSHSKDLALPGERIGYLAVSPRVKNLSLVMEGMTFSNRILGFVNAPALMQQLVTGLQRESVDIALYQEKRDILYNNLTEMGFKMVKPAGAFYLFPVSPIPDDVEFVKAAQKYNILLVPGAGFGKPGYFRMTYCIDKQIILNSLPAFRELAKEFSLS
ncbi:pyridoxal phosphate-dependent aminotransferase [Phosphitispora sp. TUW77]|uniref:pyridoxal phosphate-dependent aminotransferase n=1 Tax=Phosphitispora sp. TUW77 TaxID=3152361 RepID=UPI003AB5E31D